MQLFLRPDSQRRKTLKPYGKPVCLLLVSKVYAFLVVNPAEQQPGVLFPGDSFPYLYRCRLIAEEIYGYRYLVRTLIAKIEPFECDILHLASGHFNAALKAGPERDAC